MNHPPDLTRAQLLARRADFVRELAAERERFERGLLDRCLQHHEAAERWCEIDGRYPTIDVLMISGGGDRGAFGAGFLRAWGEVTGDLARPRFDCVTGVSTGAMIAPYAFIGTDEAYEQIEGHYREPDPDWGRRRFSRALLTGGEGLLDNSALRRFVRGELTEGFVRALAEGNAEGRKLLIGATNADTGFMRAFDLTGFASPDRCEACVDRITDVITASAAIPGAFPPVQIDGHLYIDGGVTMQLFLPGARRMVDQMQGPIAELNARGVRIPEIRVWVIVNNCLNPEPAVTLPRWYSILQRGLGIAIKTAGVVALRDLKMFADLATATAGVRMSVRYVAIPDDHVDPPGAHQMFDRAAMNKLADLGREMGRDPASWRTRVPSPESADSYALDGLSFAVERGPAPGENGLAG